MSRDECAAARNRDCRATWDAEVGDLALIYVYAPGRTGTAPGESKRQVAQPAQAIFDYAEDGTLLGVEVLASRNDDATSVDDLRSKLAGWHFSQESLTGGEREILSVADAVLAELDRRDDDGYAR
jgi:hypothetical protein